MHSILIGLTGLVAPGFAHGLMSQRRAMAIVVGLVVVCIVGTLLVPWSIYLALVVVAGSMIEAGLRHRRLLPNIRWSWRYPLIAVLLTFVIPLLARVFVVEAFKIPSSSMYPTFLIDDHFFANKLAMRWRGPERGEVIVFRQPCMPERDYIMRVIALGGDTVEVRCSAVYVNGAAVPATLIAANDRYRDREYSDEERWFERSVSRYRETIGDHTFEVFHDEDRPARDERRKAGAEAEGDDKDFPRDVVGSCSNVPHMEGGPAANQHPGTIVTTDPGPTDLCKPHRHYVVPPGHAFVMGDNRDNSNDSRF